MENKSKELESTPWVFVYGNVNQNEGNAFHLECSEEPIQELTEHDMYLTGSDAESDKNTDTSDGISIISESEIPLEDNCTTYNDCFNVEDIHGSEIVENRIACTNLLCVQPIDESDNDNKTDWKTSFKTLNVLSAGVIVVAVLVSTISSFINLESSGSEPRTDTTAFDRNTVDEIVDKTVSCACRDKQMQLYEMEGIKQCVYNSLNKINNNPTERRSGDCKEPTTKHRNDNIVQGDNFNFVKTKQSNKYGPTEQHKQYKQFKNKKDKSKVTGEWYNNIHKYRAELRKNGERDKAQWYFKRVRARQDSRRGDH